MPVVRESALRAVRLSKNHARPLMQKDHSPAAPADVPFAGHTPMMQQYARLTFFRSIFTSNASNQFGKSHG
jgi:hypothetical protein